VGAPSCGRGIAGRLAGDLQDNNQIDFEGDKVSGYSYTHALLPTSPAIDLAPPEACGVAALNEITIPSGTRYVCEPEPEDPGG